VASSRDAQWRIRSHGRVRPLSRKDSRSSVRTRRIRSLMNVAIIARSRTRFLRSVKTSEERREIVGELTR
jgi:hypothetical protein